jgi:hypothetical protein
MAWTDADALHRHAWKAYEDFRRLRTERWNQDLWHSLSHHLRHVVHRSGEEVTNEPRHQVRRHRNG